VLGTGEGMIFVLYVSKARGREFRERVALTGCQALSQHALGVSSKPRFTVLSIRPR